MKENKLYSIAQLVDSIIIEYNLPTDSKPNDKTIWTSYRQKISRVLKESGIWDSGIDNTVGKKTTKYFTEQQKQRLLADKSLYDYLRDRSQSEEIRNSKRYQDVQDAIETRRIAHINFISSQTQDDIENNIPIITNEKFRKVKNDMMLKAIFEKIFTPINEELLLNDLYQVLIFEDELALDTADIEAEHRLSHPEGYYYTTRKN
ncbi:MAG: hypothetical protein IJE43_13720 [Alphaproteobacteria bacterium]|nr:hypothetical protein [Alphaproteobacteria bacterium]